MKLDLESARSREKNGEREEGDSFILGGWIHLHCRAFGVYKAYLSV